MKNIKVFLCIAGLLCCYSWSSAVHVFPEYPHMLMFGQKFFEDFLAAGSSTEMSVGKNYVLGQGDHVIIHIWGFVEDEYEREVNADGDIFIPKVGKIHLGGLFFPDASAVIEKSIARKYKNIHISVSMGKLRSLQIFILGDVKKPGSYEIFPQSGFLEVLSLSGGPNEMGSLRKIKIVGKSGKVRFLDLYPFLLKGENPPDVRFAPGDTVFVPLCEKIAGIVGDVKRPGIYEIGDNSVLGDILFFGGGLLPRADLSRIQVERTDQAKGKVFIDLSESDAGFFRLCNYDVVRIFRLPEETFYEIILEGPVKQPGTYGWKKGLCITDIVKEKDLLPDASRQMAEIIRTKETGEILIIPFSPSKLFAGNDRENLLLQPRDRIVVFSTLRPEKRVFVKGQVMFPGEYVVSSGERLADVLQRAGGFTSDAYLPGTIFLRESVRVEKERQLRLFIEEKKTNLEKEANRIEGEQEKKLIERGKMLLQQLSESDVKGRLVIKMEPLGKFRNSRYNLYLENGDVVFVPKNPVSVAIVGEVNHPTNIFYQKNFKFKDYISDAGSLTKDAAKRDIFIVKDNGTASRNLTNIAVGDTIVVPFEAKERVGKIIRDVVQMIYQVSLSISTF